MFIVFYVNGSRIGSVERTDANLKEAHESMRLTLIQEDTTGTLHFNVLGVK